MGSRFTPSMGVALTALVLAVSGGGAYAFAATSGSQITACAHKHGGALYVAGKCRRHDKQLHWNVAGPQGPRGAQGPQGPGATEYTYDSTAPAATPQNSPLGPAGPFSKLTGSCTVSGSIVEVTLGATNANNVEFDEVRNDETNGGAPGTLFQSLTQNAESVPSGLLGEANDNNAGDGYNETTMNVTSPVHGVLEVFQHVSHANNTCHMSVVWTPAS